MILSQINIQHDYFF